MKSIVKLEMFYYPWELKQAIANFVDYYNNHRYHEALDVPGSEPGAPTGKAS